MSIQRAADPPINPHFRAAAVASTANCDRAITFGSDHDDGGGGGGGEAEDGWCVCVKRPSLTLSGIAIISARSDL